MSIAAYIYILYLEAPTRMGPRTHIMPHLGVQGPMLGGTSNPNFFWEVQKVPIGPLEKNQVTRLTLSWIF